MKITFYYLADDKPKKINFTMHDVFNDKAIKREAKKVIKTRWPEAVGKIEDIKWEY